MKKTDLSYAAGIFDGEGCISLVRLSKNRQYIQLHVTVSNTNEWLIQWFRMAFGGHVRLMNDGRAEKKWKPVYHWVVYSKEALEFLQSVCPYLRLKKPQAEIAIKFLEMRGKKGRWFTDEERAVSEAQRIIMAGLNKRGGINKVKGGG